MEFDESDFFLDENYIIEDNIFEIIDKIDAIAFKDIIDVAKKLQNASKSVLIINPLWLKVLVLILLKLIASKNSYL